MKLELQWREKLGIFHAYETLDFEIVPKLIEIKCSLLSGPKIILKIYRYDSF